MKTTLYQKTRIGKIQQWSIWVEASGDSGFPEVWIEHGQVDGKKQLTHDVIEKGVNEGKANETTPFKQAELMAKRRIKKQRERGYAEEVTSLDKKHEINFTAPFPKELCFYKPKNSIEKTKLDKLNDPVFTVKRDGMMHLVRKTKKFGVEIYSRRMDLVTDRYPHLEEAFSNLPNNTILLGEMVLINDDKDNFNGVSQICRSDADKAIVKQEELGKVKYYAFDLAFLKGQNMLTEYGWTHRYGELKGIVDNCANEHVLLVEIIHNTHDKALKETKKRKLEGLVIWDKLGLMKDGGAFTFNGKPYRPNVLWKSKPKYEDDFIVRFDPAASIGDFGSGKHHGKVGNVFLYQLDDKGEEVYITKCGGGLSDEQREYYLTAEYPRVWCVEYDSIQPKTGSLRFPVFNADRTISDDKYVSECLLSSAIKKARKNG